MKLIAQQEGTERYLIVTENNKAFIADFDLEIRYENMNKDSIINKGYWLDINHDDDLVKKAKQLPVKKTG